MTASAPLATCSGPGAARDGLRTGPFWALLAAIALVAGFLRFYRLFWGLEDGVIFPDEWVWWRRAAAFVPLSCSSFEAIGLPLYPYPTLYGYIVGSFTALGTAVGVMEPPSPPPIRDLEVIGLARAVAALAGTGAVVVTGLLGARLYSRAVGVAAAALFAVTPLHAWQTHYASVDPLLTLLFAAVCLPCATILQRGGAAPALAAGAVAGLALATKYTGLSAVVPVAWAVLARAYQERSWRAFWIGASCAGVAFFAALVLACPTCVFEFPKHYGAMRWLQHVLWNTDAFPGYRLVPSVGWYGRPYLYELFATLPWGLGWPLYALSLAGVAFAVWRRTAADVLLLLAVVIPNFVVVGGTPLAFARYLLPIYPALLVLGARAALALPRPRLGIAVVAATALYSGWLSFAQIAGFSLDQQKQVARWIAQDARPRSARVAIPSTLLGYDALEPFLAAQKLGVVKVREGEWWMQRAEYFVLPERVAAVYERGAPDGPIAQDVRRLRAGELGYQPVKSFEDLYPQRALYAWLDPGLHPALGAYGFTVYRREAEPAPRRRGPP
jgi:4-amino-4-deoxy-L-arabinose transferase-like glycosyltransferase